MIVIEYKIKAKQHQYLAIDEAIRTGQFVRNKALRYWMDNKGVSKYDLNKYCRVLAKEYAFANKLNSTARQSSAERAWSGIARFFDNCKKKVKGKKGFPKFKKHSRSVEYKQSGWKLDEKTKKHITFTDKIGIGRVKLVGSNEKRLNRLNRRKSKKYRKGKPQSKNYHKARFRYAKLHLKVSRQREEHAKKLARCVCASNDCIVYEDLNVRNLVRNRRLSKSISDAGWSLFRKWVEYFGWKFGKITIAVSPHYTSQDCPACGERIKKSLSNRTHICKCGYVEDRDIAASVNILKKGLSTEGHSGTYAWGETPSWAVGATLRSNGDSLNQESPTTATIGASVVGVSNNEVESTLIDIGK